MFISYTIILLSMVIHAPAANFDNELQCASYPTYMYNIRMYYQRMSCSAASPIRYHSHEVSVNESGKHG